MTTVNGWPSVPLGEVLVKNETIVSLSPAEKYREVTIRLWGKGVMLRRIVSGAEIAAERRYCVSTDQFIASRIDARNGAMGLVPSDLDGAVVTNDFPSFEVNRERLLPGFLGWLSRTTPFIDLCRAASEGTTNRVRLKEDRFLRLPIPLPPLEVQERIVTRIDRLADKVAQVRQTKREIGDKTTALLRSQFSRIVDGAPRCKMSSAAPLVRRKAEMRAGEEYPELGIRSFGRGTFHKAALDYIAVGSKKLYRIEPGDLVFNNVFAWEGAIAVAQPEDRGRFGSHRFITCVPHPDVATAEFLAFYFLTPEGLERIGKASPGGAGRNRTLGIEKLLEIEVPIPSHDQQSKFGRLLQTVRTMQTSQATATKELDAMLPAILDRAFKGKLS
ncbi:MAG: restriction endonuclease subunit S [Phycisphaerales bacterium]|nr:restriction endonuclease subunit S [Phycisphaerales bacterium]